MTAVILAGGKGTRLRPYTVSLPKPLMPVGDRPILEIVIQQLKKAGVRRVIIAVGYLESLIRAYFGNGRRFGVEIIYSSEHEPLGTRDRRIVRLTHRGRNESKADEVVRLTSEGMAARPESDYKSRAQQILRQLKR